MNQLAEKDKLCGEIRQRGCKVNVELCGKSDKKVYRTTRNVKYNLHQDSNNVRRSDFMSRLLGR